ncbi:divergent protein kinase domain 1C-like [Littorina saxatilis]|uniref:FAM69 N-terminal domain-containing protein n=1 Tax=Littorina saxatilis TaxID=31220 RepID=A0AAN9BZ12_9CAEN
MLRWLRRRICQRCFFLLRRIGVVAFFCGLGTICLLASIICLVYTFRSQLFDSLIKCSDKESNIYIDDFCQLYRQGEITGSLCHPLCQTGQVKFSACTNFHGGKQVQMMKCNDFCQQGRTISSALKSPNHNISRILSDHPGLLPTDAESSNFKNYMNEALRERVRLELGFDPIPPDTDVLKLMWEEDYEQFLGTSENRTAAYRTIMMLMEQTEYLLGKVLYGSGVVPRLYGTCGPLYLQESCPPGLLDRYIISVARTTPAPVSWQQEASTGIKLLKLIKQLEEDFPQVLHSCDVKGSNFGVCDDGSVRIIDADNLFFHKQMMDIFNRSTCKTHSDCNFFDCGGWCYVDSGTCWKGITNNNLQTMCRDVLKHPYMGLFNWGEMLSDAPASIAGKLSAAVEECVSSHTSEENGIPVNKPPLSVLAKIMQLLMQSAIGEEVL